MNLGLFLQTCVNNHYLMACIHDQPAHGLFLIQCFSGETLRLPISGSFWGAVAHKIALRKMRKTMRKAA